MSYYKVKGGIDNAGTVEAMSLLANRDDVEYSEWDAMAARLGVAAPGPEEIALFIEMTRKVVTETRSGKLPPNTDVTQEVIYRLEKWLDLPPSSRNPPPGGSSSSSESLGKALLKAA